MQKVNFLPKKQGNLQDFTLFYLKFYIHGVCNDVDIVSMKSSKRNSVFVKNMKWIYYFCTNIDFVTFDPNL